MCMEDVLIGRDTAVTVHNDPVGLASAALVDRDDKRTMLTFFPPTTGIAYIMPVEDAAATKGLYLAPGMRPITFTVQEHGQLVYKPWNAIHSVGGVTITWIEGRLSRQS